MKERRPRTRARELALQQLHALDLGSSSQLDDPDAFFEHMAEEAPIPLAAREYALTLIRGVVAHRAELDREIARAAQNWELSRMAVVDRNLLRLALYELRHHPEVPPKVVINEAVELGKTYSTEQTGAFVNGILDALARQGSPPALSS